MHWGKKGKLPLKSKIIFGKKIIFYLFLSIGFGDASCVGAGKTLTAIAVMDKLLMARNNNPQQQNNNNSGYSGFLVLIPSK